MRPVAVAMAMLVFAGAENAQSPPGVNPDAALVKEFGDRIAAYVKLRKTAEAGLPPVKPGSGSHGIPERQKQLAERIRELRKGAQPGDICTPEIAAELRRLIGIAMQGANSTRVRKSLRSAEPVALHLQVNDPFPEKVPLQSTPPTLLINLPRLPAEVDYRIAGKTLVLRDTGANIVVDFVTHAFPE